MPPVRALLLVDIVDSTEFAQRLGDLAAAEWGAAHDKPDGFLLLFDNVGDAAHYAFPGTSSISRCPPAMRVQALERRARSLDRVARDLLAPWNGREIVVRSTDEAWLARTVVSSTGNWRHPFVPAPPGRERFQGTQRHSADYVEPSPFADLRVLIVGGGNSGAQILAEVSQIARTTWVTDPPEVPAR